MSAALPANDTQPVVPLDRATWRSMGEDQVARRVQLLNGVTGLALGVCGFLGFIVPTFSLTIVVSSLYVMIFCLLLICYEIRLFREWLLRNCAFLFKSRGRALFIVFVGSITLGFSWLAYIFAPIALFTAIINVWAGEKFTSIRWDADLAQALGKESAAIPASSNSQYQPPEPPVVEHKPKTGPLASSAPVWEEITDPETGNKYFLNKQSGQTSWTKPIDYEI